MVVYFNEYTHKKKLKREELKKKNRHHLLLFQLMRIRRADAARVKEDQRKLQPKRQEQPSGEWSDKVSKVRNRLTGRKRESKERWNRFAGTSDAGGRGL